MESVLIRKKMTGAQGQLKRGFVAPGAVCAWAWEQGFFWFHFVM